MQLHSPPPSPTPMAQPHLHTRKEGRAATIWMVVIIAVLVLGYIAWSVLKRSEHSGPNNPGTPTSQLHSPQTVMPSAAYGRAG